MFFRACGWELSKDTTSSRIKRDERKVLGYGKQKDSTANAMYIS